MPAAGLIVSRVLWVNSYYWGGTPDPAGRALRALFISIEGGLHPLELPQLLPSGGYSGAQGPTGATGYL